MADVEIVQGILVEKEDEWKLKLAAFEPEITELIDPRKEGIQVLSNSKYAIAVVPKNSAAANIVRELKSIVPKIKKSELEG